MMLCRLEETRRQYIEVCEMATVKIIISGGQTGADRAALDFALADGLEIKGYCPNGRRADDGPLDPKYPLQETISRAYAPRTEKNVTLADVTVIFDGLPELSSGSHTTIRYARQHKKKYKLLQGFPDTDKDAAELQSWLQACKPLSLNVAGNGERKCPGMYRHVLAVLQKVFKPA
jgi:hypothetical protein